MIGEVLGLNGGLAQVHPHGRTITLTVCEAAHGKLEFLLKTAGLNVPLGENTEVLAGNGGQTGFHRLKYVWLSGGKWQKTAGT